MEELQIKLPSKNSPPKILAHLGFSLGIKILQALMLKSVHFLS